MDTVIGPVIAAVTVLVLAYIAGQVRIIARVPGRMSEFESEMRREVARLHSELKAIRSAIGLQV